MNSDMEIWQQQGVSAVSYDPSWQSRVIRSSLKWLRGRLDYTKPVAEQRVDFENLARWRRLSRNVDVQTTTANGFHAEWIAPTVTAPDRTILFVHGGGFILGSCKTHRTLAAQIAIACKARAMLFDYRLAPEHPYPAGLDDTVTVYRSLLQTGTDPGKLILMGDSSGGNLVLAALIVLRDAGDRLPACAVCMSPPTDLTGSGETMTSNARRAPFLKPEDLVGNPQYVGDSDPASPLVSPLFADLHGLPPILIQVGSDEIMLSDSTRFAAKARQAGSDVTAEVWDGMWHLWHNFAPFLPEANRAIAHVGHFVDQNQSAASS